LISALSDNILTPSVAQRIEPLPAGVERPLWSVMIPTFNGTKYLPQALESILAQDPGPENMQIEIVDDASTEDDPMQVVNALAPGRVRFYRNPKNLGLMQNFNTCIRRSRGKLVHILHQDDYVGVGFYTSVQEAFELSCNCAIIFTRVFVVDDRNCSLGISEYCDALRAESNDPRNFMTSNPIRAPGVVVRRDFYERSGGFDPTLVHTGDWEMWVRATLHGGGRMLDKPLAYYRWSLSNATNRQARSAEHLRDCLRLAEKWKRENLPGFDRNSFDRAVVRFALGEWRRFRALGDYQAAAANYAFWRSRARTLDRLRAARDDAWAHLSIKVVKSSAKTILNKARIRQLRRH
jgi:glycosyltransferase involved in cell wall biosynthesis